MSTGSYPAVRARAATDAQASALVASTCQRARANTGSPGFSGSATAAGASPGSHRAHAASYAARVLASGSVGPEATALGSSPATSDRIQLSCSTPAPAAAANLPPLKAELCLRTRLISPIGAPLATRRRFRARKSSKLPCSGTSAMADPPPEIRATRSAGRGPRPRARAAASMAAPARKLSALGSGCPPTNASTGNGACRSASGAEAEISNRVARGSAPRCSADFAQAAAIEPAALPNATTAIARYAARLAPSASFAASRCPGSSSRTTSRNQAATWSLAAMASVATGADQRVQFGQRGLHQLAHAPPVVVLVGALDFVDCRLQPRHRGRVGGSEIAQREPRSAQPRGALELAGG